MPLTVPAAYLQGPVNGTSLAVGQQAVNAARKWLGTPYAWGGGDKSGPTLGIRDGGVADRFGDYAKKGFDCSGLMDYAWGAVGVDIGGDTLSQWAKTSGNRVSPPYQAGDLLFYTHGSGRHVAMAIGDGSSMIEAPQSGDVVKISKLREPNKGATRPQGGTTGNNIEATPESGANSTPTTVGSLTGVSMKAWVVIGAVAVVGVILVVNGGLN